MPMHPDTMLMCPSAMPMHPDTMLMPSPAMPMHPDAMLMRSSAMPMHPDTMLMPSPAMPMHPDALKTLRFYAKLYLVLIMSRIESTAEAFVTCSTNIYFNHFL